MANIQLGLFAMRLRGLARVEYRSSLRPETVTNLERGHAMAMLLMPCFLPHVPSECVLCRL